MPAHSCTRSPSPCEATPSTVRTAALAVLLFVSCMLLPQLASPAAAQDALPDSTRQDAEAVVEVFAGLAKLVDANRGDCAKMGVALDKWSVQNAERIVLMQQALERLAALPEAQNALMEQEYGAKLEQFEGAMVALFECATDPKIISTLERLLPDASGTATPPPSEANETSPK